jgi:hypothetical protein
MSQYKTLRPAISIEEVERRCPVAFTKEPSRDLSKHYVHMDTSVVIQDMMELGWVPVDAKQRKPKGKGTKYTPHMVAFQNPDIQIQSGDELLAPTILLNNSHDGTSAFRFRVGIYRLVCSNGLVIPESEYSSFKIRHKGYTFETLRSRLKGAVVELPKHVEIINKMVVTNLTDEQKLDFALKAMLLRSNVNAYGAKVENTYTEETLRSIITPVRNADMGDDLWKTFNVIQESMIRGGFAVQVEGKRARKLKPVTSFLADQKLNEELFELALEYVN